MPDLNVSGITDSSALTENAVVNLIPLTDTGKVLGNSFGPLVNDANRNAMTGALGNTFQTKDGSASPVNSPVTAGAAETVIRVPQQAVSVQFYATTNDTRISKDPNFADYFTLKAGVLIEVDCAREDYIYVKRDASSDATLQFIFKIV